MGLDLALGGLVAVMAIRGWFKGFVLQAIRLGGVVLCVYAADPVRDVAKPEVIGYLPTIRPDLVDRLLWWASAVVAYVVLVGLSTLAVKLYRRQPYGLEEPNRNDQLAGSLLGGAKGLLVASLIALGIETYALDRLKSYPWAEQQARSSYAMEWHGHYRPIARLWATPQVQHFVRHVREMGLTRPGDKGAGPAAAPVQTAHRVPELQIP